MENKENQDISNNLLDFKSYYNNYLEELRNERNSFIEQIQGYIKIEKYNFPSSTGHKTIAQLKQAHENTTFFDSTSFSSNLLSSTHMSTARKSAKKTNLKKTKHSDEGYLTADTQRTRSSDRARRSPDRSDVKKRKSRSLSRPKVVKNVTIQAISPPKKSTPERRMPPPGDYAFVTPKVKPNAPLSVLRRPKQGEMALSMQGSPLLVNSIITEACANVNIPLEDGRVISLQPCKNIRMSQMPAIPDDTRQQLAKLRDHLNIVCQQYSQ